MLNKKTIAIVGSGNVAFHLHKALDDKTKVFMVNPRTLEGFPVNPDLTLICVSDDAIEEVCNKIPKIDGIIAHTSGSIQMNVLKGEKIGAFYPLQTFTKDRELNYGEIPVFIEGSSPYVVYQLKEIACLFSHNVNEADSESRKHLHLASVFACNFTNALIGISEDILKETNLEFSVLLPLLKQTVNKLETMSPKEAQTGPAVRGDTKVIEKHLQMLDTKPSLKEIYHNISTYILHNHGL